MPGEPLTPPGFYGKIPSRGDFVSRRLPRAFLDPWDSWLQRAVAASRSALGEAWLDAYLTGPIWRFALPPGLCGEQAVTGLLMPSVDSVGRYYPMTIATLLPERPNPFLLASRQEDWFAAAEDLALSCLDGQFELEAFDEELQKLSKAETRISSTGSSSTGSSSIGAQQDAPGALLSWSTDWLDQEQLFAAAFPELLDAVARGRGETYSLWWTTGSDRVPPSLRSYAELPSEIAFTSFLQTGTAAS